MPPRPVAREQNVAVSPPPMKYETIEEPVMQFEPIFDAPKPPPPQPVRAIAEVSEIMAFKSITQSASSEPKEEKEPSVASSDKVMAFDMW